jgi:type I restriction enzyme S subunit
VAKRKDDIRVPNLRFPEFKEEWEEKRFSEVGEFFKGAGISKDKLSKEGNPCILYGELYTKYKYEVIEDIYSKTDIDAKGLIKNKINDIIIPSSGESAIEIATARCINVIDVFLGGDLNIIRPKKDNGNFISYQLNGKRKFDIAKIAQGSSVTHLYNESLKKLIINIPTDIGEQNKIASLLSLINTRIQAQSKIIGELDTLIKETCKKHYNSVEKKEYLISDLGQPYSTMNLSKTDLSQDGNECIIYGELFTVYDCVIDKIKSFTKCNAPKTSLSGENDLLFPTSTTVNALSLICPSAISKKGVILGGDMFGIHLYKEFNNEYLSYVINYLYKDALAKYAKGSTIIHLQYNDIKKFKIMLPNLTQQETLSSLLRLMRNKAMVDKKKLALLKQQKQFMLGNLFI